MKKYSWQKIFIILIAVAAIFLLSFYYAFLTDFPIGDDAAVHIASGQGLEKNFSFQALKNNIYPIPLVLFTLFHKIFSTSWPHSFVLTICFYSFLASLGVGFLAFGIFKDWRIGIAAAIFFTCSRWVNDMVRIGLLAEIWGVFVFCLAAYFLVKRNIWGFLIFFSLLFFSHPLSFSVMLLVFILYGILILITGQKKERFFFLKIISLMILLGTVFYWLKPKMFSQILAFPHLQGGARTLKTIISEMDRRRMLLYLVAFGGAIRAAGIWGKKGIKFLILLLGIGLLLSLNHYFGINFIPFRFYPYFEIAIAILAGFGLFGLIDAVFPSKVVFLSKMGKCFLASFFIFLLVMPNYLANKSIALWQIKDSSAQAMLPEQDKEAFSWIRENSPPNAKFVAQHKWGAWLKPMAERNLIDSGIIFSPEIKIKQVQQFVKNYGINYIYFSSIQPENLMIEDNPEFFEQVYKKDKVRIYKVRKNAE